jgi:hypothetical protein
MIINDQRRSNYPGRAEERTRRGYKIPLMKNAEQSQKTDDRPAPNSIEEVRLAVENIKKCVQDRGPIEEMRELVKVLVGGYSVGTPRFLPGSRFYRARIMPGSIPPISLFEIGVPPKAYSRLNQRCNRAGQPMFYCSDHPSAPLSEVDAEVGDYVVLSEWSITKHLLAWHVGYSEASFKKLGARRACPPLWVNPPEFMPPEHEAHQREVNKYLAELFTEKVPTGDEHLYAPSIAITETVLSWGLVDNKGLFDGQELKFEAVMYPTIALRASCENLALSAEFASDALLLDAADFVRVIKVGSMGEYELQYLGSVTAWRDPRDLIWGMLPPEGRIDQRSTRPMKPIATKDDPA